MVKRRSSKLRKTTRTPGGRSSRPMKVKVCRFCAEKNAVINYKDVNRLRNYVSERGKIMPRRISGNCAWHQRQLTQAIKRARNIALLPFTAD